MSDGILDAFIGSQQVAALQAFNPQSSILKELERLSVREREVLVSRHGLSNGEPQTLEHIGKVVNLTRERIRQIEKDAIGKLRGGTFSQDLERGIELVYQIIEEHGNIMREARLLETLLPNPARAATQAIQFILNLSDRFVYLEESPEFNPSWHLRTFDLDHAREVLSDAVAELEKGSKPQPADALNKPAYGLPAQAFESLLQISKKVDRNAFGLWGLSVWSEIVPRDVGDKAHLILKHHGSPEHYAKITELINKQKFDDRTAHKETVHNELIKDSRFVLVGRGIYALSEWGYKKGVVAEIISQVLQSAGRPLSKNEIIEEVLKQRQVKRNTIIVGLSNKGRFRKTEDNKYINTNVQ